MQAYNSSQFSKQTIGTTKDSTVKKEILFNLNNVSKEIKNNRGSNIDEKSNKLKLWKLKIVLQIRRWNESFYHNIFFNKDSEKDPEEGYRNETPKPYIDEDNNLDLMLEDVDWIDRMKITRNEINNYLDSQSEKIFDTIKDWFIYENEDYSDPISIEKIDLNLSYAHVPAVSLTVIYGPTKHDSDSITQIINNSFEHWADAGDYSFTIVYTHWKEKHSINKQLYNQE